MTLEEAMKKNPQMGPRQIWEQNEELQKIEYPEFAKAWHNARMAKLKPKPANTNRSRQHRLSEKTRGSSEASS